MRHGGRESGVDRRTAGRGSLMSATTFGDLLDRGRGDLRACTTVSGSGESAIVVAQAAGRVALTLSRCLGDVAPYGMTEAITSGAGSLAQATVDGQEALRQGGVSPGGGH